VRSGVKEIVVAPSQEALAEALKLADETLRNVELSEVSIGIGMLKASRLARLVGDRDMQLAFEYEASGYPSTTSGIEQDVWRIAKLAGRVYETKEKENGKENLVERCYTDSVEVIEQRILTNRAALETARDPNVSISSANPSQYVSKPAGNVLERNALRTSISDDQRRLSSRRGFLHRYVASKYDEIRFSGIANDIFSRIRNATDPQIGQAVPKAAAKLTAIYDNLRSENPEDWANAVHSCRRMLQDLADVLMPPGADRELKVGGTIKVIKMGADNYVNRLIAFIEDNSKSKRFASIVGSNLGFIGDRLDAAFKAAQKGSHSEIATRAEADRYVVYTYLLIADLLSLSTVPMRDVAPSIEAGDRAE
jgi:hypothetical protein